LVGTPNGGERAVQNTDEALDLAPTRRAPGGSCRESLCEPLQSFGEASRSQKQTPPKRGLFSCSGYASSGGALLFAAPPGPPHQAQADRQHDVDFRFWDGDLGQRQSRQVSQRQQEVSGVIELRIGECLTIGNFPLRACLGDEFDQKNVAYVDDEQVIERLVEVDPGAVQRNAVMSRGLEFAEEPAARCQDPVLGN
jgi:hypothetical protein